MWSESISLSNVFSGIACGVGIAMPVLAINCVICSTNSPGCSRGARWLAPCSTITSAAGTCGSVFSRWAASPNPESSLPANTNAGRGSRPTKGPQSSLLPDSIQRRNAVRFISSTPSTAVLRTVLGSGTLPVFSSTHFSARFRSLSSSPVLSPSCSTASVRFCSVIGSGPAGEAETSTRPRSPSRPATSFSDRRASTAATLPPMEWPAKNQATSPSFSGVTRARRSRSTSACT